MKATLFSLVFAAGALAQTFMINTPANAVVCQPLLLTWTGGTPPYFLSILPGGQPSAPALVDLGKQDGNSVTWLVNQAQGSSLGLNLRDSSGQVAQSAAFTVNGGSDTSCVGQNPSSSAATPGGPPPATTGGAPPPPVTTSAAGATTSAAAPPVTSAASPAVTSRPPASSAAGSTVSRSSAAASASASNAASANFAQIGTAGVVGAALAALLA